MPRSRTTLPPVGRRQLLRLSGATGLAVAAVSGLDVAVAPAARRAQAAEAVVGAVDVRPFALADVTLSPSVFTRKRDLVLDHARGYDVDRLLSVFRANAGLDTLGAVAPSGWEGLDGEANGNLRGHYGGHFLSMLAQASAAGDDADGVLARKLTAMVQGMHDSREALRRANPWPLSVEAPRGRGIRNVRGSYQYAAMPAAAVQGLTACTLSVWVRPERQDNWARVVEAGSSTTSYLFLAARTNDGRSRFAITTAGGGSNEQVLVGPALPVGEWSHLVVTLDGTTGSLYVDGTRAAQGPVTLTPASLGTIADLWLGRSHYPDPLLAGAFSQLDVYSRALDATEVASLSSLGAAGSTAGRGDRGSWPLGDSGTATLDDASAAGRDGTLRRTWGGPSHPGFLAAYPETQFIDLETRTASDYTVVWAPYYTAHKILKGLIDAHHNTTDATTKAQALDLASGLCDWAHSRLSKLSDATLQRMWSLFSSGEFGGLQEAIVDTWDVTGKPEHLELAQLFNLERLISAAAADQDVLTGLHANQHAPIFNGLVRLHDATGEARYLTAARNFWPMVAEHRSFAMGGTSDREFWGARDVVAGTASADSAETCCSHNMLKLSRLLFMHEQDPRYMEYYERTLFNHILGSKQDATDAELPLMTYFVAQQPGGVRDYTPKAGTTCCEGTGLESATKYQDTVYLRAADDSALWVNLFSATTLSWASKGVTVTQTTAFPTEQGTTLTVGVPGGGTRRFTLHVRKPAWAGPGYRVQVAGSVVDTAEVEPGTYVSIDRAWADGDRVEVSTPFTLRTETPPDDPGLKAVFYGPIHLVARAPGGEMGRPLSATTRLSGDLGATFVPMTGQPLHFRTGELEWAPFLEGTTDPYHSYVRDTTPTVVLGGVDSGVANVRSQNGVSVLDDVWDQAPFPTKTDFVDHVRTVAMQRRVSGDLNTADLQRVLLAAGKARVQA